MNVAVLLPDGQVEVFRDTVPVDVADDEVVTAVIHECVTVDWTTLQITRVV